MGGNCSGSVEEGRIRVGDNRSTTFYVVLFISNHSACSHFHFHYPENLKLAAYIEAVIYNFLEVTLHYYLGSSGIFEICSLSRGIQKCAIVYFKLFDFTFSHGISLAHNLHLKANCITSRGLPWIASAYPLGTTLLRHLAVPAGYLICHQSSVFKANVFQASTGVAYRMVIGICGPLGGTWQTN